MLRAKYKLLIPNFMNTISTIRTRIWNFFKFIELLLLILFLELIIIVFYYGYQVDIFTTLLAFLLLVDGFYLGIHIFRRPHRHNTLRFDPDKLTIVIACYNGEDILEETIRQASLHVPRNQIIVVSDCSTDQTPTVARNCGVRVIDNKRNLQKALSISNAMKYVHTPYVLILDDDTLIGETFIPTSLLDEGYRGVAFKVLPVAEDSLINKLQCFEYERSMCFGKELRGSVGGVGNISGAIGLYHTKDLRDQVTKHSGQFSGEDQQRTSLVHLETDGKGVTYTDSAVYTIAPDSIRTVYKQRAYRWNLQGELFIINLRMLVRRDVHFLLKMENLMDIYLFFTDPLRILGFWLLLFQPTRFLAMYGFYILLSVLAWIKIGRKAPLWIVPFYPLYGQIDSFGRVVARFYWFKVKYQYFFKHQYQDMVPERSLAIEYTITSTLSVLILGVSLFTLVGHLINFNGPVVRVVIVALVSCILFAARWANVRYDNTIPEHPARQVAASQTVLAPETVRAGGLGKYRYRIRDFV